MGRLMRKLCKWWYRPKNRETLESIAAIEHQQWVSWAKATISAGLVSEDTERRWKIMFVPYRDLSVFEKEKSRFWAQVILDELGY